MEILPPALTAFQKAVPRVKLLLHDLSSDELIAGLRDATLELAIMRESMKWLKRARAANLSWLSHFFHPGKKTTAFLSFDSLIRDTGRRHPGLERQKHHLIVRDSPLLLFVAHAEGISHERHSFSRLNRCYLFRGALAFAWLPGSR